jgi:hypothetical protein
MNYKCHPVSDSHPYNSRIYCWCVIGPMHVVVRDFLSEAKEEIQKLDPEATFLEYNGFSDENLEFYIERSRHYYCKVEGHIRNPLDYCIRCKNSD